MLHYDDHNLLVTQDGDGGDTFHKEGVLAFVSKMLEDLGIKHAYRSGRAHYEWALSQCFNLDREPVLVRHPYQYTDRMDYAVSRDQLKPNFAAFIMYREDPIISVYAKKILGCLREKDYPSKDFMFWEVECVERRLYNNAKYLWIYDLYLLGSAMALVWLPRWDHDNHRFSKRDDGDVGDDVNFSTLLMACLQKSPTWTARIAALIYFKFRPWNYGVNLGDYDPAEGAWAWYFRTSGGDGNTSLADMFIIAKRKVLDDQA